MAHRMAPDSPRIQENPRASQTVAPDGVRPRREDGDVPAAGLIRYRYILAEPAVCGTRIRLDMAVALGAYVHMAESGVMTVGAGYARDGPSGPAPDGLEPRDVVLTAP